MDDRDSGPDWAKQVGVPDESPKVRVNVTQGCLYRELGMYSNRVPNEFLWAAEDKLIEKATYDELKCQLPDSPRSTFLMVFSPDGKKVASTHGNHNVYVTDLTTGKNIQTLSGHPRTPWCIAFHPSSNQILASGCLAGQVRVWDLHGGSEVWTAENQSVIASLAFHPVDRMLVIATYNELHFWDWSQAKPFAKCSTKSEKEKVRYVSFDRLGNKLITGIANPVNTPPQWERVNVVTTQPTVTTSATATTTTAPSTTAVATTSSSQSQTRAATLCENYLLNQYSQLVRRYLDLSRSRITQTTLQMDRGTDPMDLMDGHRSRSQGDHPRHGPMPSSSHANGSRSVRYRIMRSTCRSYRPPSSRERFRIHSSLLSGLPSRTSSSSNSLVRTTTTTTTTSQSIIFTTIATSSSSSSMPQQLSRLRQCGIGFIARPVCLTISRENSSSGSPSARSSQSAQSSQSGAVTNPTYTSYSDRSISSSRESNAGDSERSRFPLIRPYRILFDDINQIRASVHSLIRPSSEENGNRNSSEQRLDVISPLDRRDRLRSQFLDVEEVEIDRDMSRSLTYVSPFRRLSSDSESTSTTPTNPQRPSPQHWVSYNSNHLPLYPRPVPRFQVRPTFDMNNTSPVRRFRDNTDSDSSTNTTPAPLDTPSSTPTTSTSPSPVQLNAGPVPRLQIRPRYLQDQSQLTSQSDNQGPGLQNNQILRRQFVLSRHSNSPFQPRVPHVVQNSGPVTTATSSTSTAATSTTTSAAASVITTAARPNSTPSSSTSTSTSTSSSSSTSSGSGSSSTSVKSTADSSTSTVASVICTATGPTSSAASSASSSAVASVISTAASVISTVASSTSTAASVICTVAAPNSTAANPTTTAAAASVITTAARSSSATVSSTSSSDEDNPICTAGRSTSATASVITTAARSPASAISSTSGAASVITTAARSASTSANSTSTAASVITTAARSASTSANSTSTAASVITTAARAASNEPSSTTNSTAASVISSAARPTSTSTSTSATSVISTASRSTSAAAGPSSATASVISTAARSTPGPRSSSAPRSTTTPTSTTSTAPRSSSACCRPEIPSCMSSFVASGSSSGARSTTTTTSPSAGSSSSRATNTATTTTAGDDSFVRTSRELRSRLHFFDHVKLLLRDRIRNSSEHASTDSTVNYSNIANELEGETQSTMDSSLEDGNAPSALEPRGLDPVLPSGSRTNDNTSDIPFFPSASSTSSGRSSAETIPSTSSSAAPDLQIGQPARGNASNEIPQSGTSTSVPGTSTQMSVTEKVRILSRHIDNMQRLCRARIEIVQLQQIRKMWEDLTAQIRTLHHAVQNRNATHPIHCPHQESRDPVNPMERLAITDNAPAPGPSTPYQPLRPVIARGRTPSPERFSDRFRNVVESMVNSILNDEDLSDDETETAPRARTRRATRQQASETDEPQPGPSGLNRSSHPRRDDIQTRLYRSLREAMKRHKRKKEAAAAAAAAAGASATATASGSGSATGAAGQSTSPRQANRGRARRSGRNSHDSSVLRGFPSLGSNLDFVINELENSTPNADPNARSPEPQPSTSRACQSCNQRRRIERNIARQQKRRTAESVPVSGSGVSPPKIVRTEVERRAMSFACPTIPNPGTPVEFYDIPGPAPTSTRELLRRMIQRMETMVRFQREAFRRAEECANAPRPGPQHSSDDSDSDDTFSRQDLRNLPKDYKATRRDIVNLGRAVTQLRARRLLDYMVQSLTEFFEESANMENSFDDQVISLYTLLHLSLELTDILLEQLNATSNDLERIWGLRHVSTRPLEVRNSELFFPEQARALRRLRERARGSSRTCIHTSIAREESRRLQNPFVRSPSRPRLSTNQNPSRMGHHSSSPGFCRYRPSSTFSPSFRRFRRASPRTSGGVPSGWWGYTDSPRRSANTPRSREGQTSVIVSNRLRSDDNNSPNQMRGVRIWERRNSVDGESDFHRDLRSDNNNNSNANLGNASSSHSGTLLAVDNSHEDGPSGSVIASTSGNAPNSNSLSFSAYLNLREPRPMFWIRYGNTNEPASGADPQSREGNFTVPVVHVNDIPVQDVSMLNQPRYRPQSPTPRGPEEMWRWRPWRPRFLHPRYSGPHTYDDQDANDVPEGVHYYRIVNTASGSNPGLYSLDPVIITDAPMSPHHRIQAWDFTQMKIPDISDREANGVVAECKIHNDASVDVSNDGHLLVTLLPSGRFSVTTMLGVYSLDWNSLGQLLYKTSFEQNAVSVSLSPTNRHLLVGLASRPLVLRDRINMAQIFRMEGARPTPPGGTWQSGRGRLVHMRDLEQTRETNIMSLNCIRWAPGAGQGLVYGTNTGQLRVLR